YGLIKGENILHTAHRTTTSHAAWERLAKVLDEANIEYKSLRATGRESIELEEGGKIEFRTRSSKGGLGEGFDLLVIDEAQEYAEDQESALKYVVTDSKNPQTLLLGTPPTPLSSGTVFTKLRTSVLNGQSQNSGWAEWSVEEESDVRDKELWYKVNPSLGTVFTERSVRDEIGTDDIDFNIQRLGLWIKYNQKSAISENEWKELQVSKIPKLRGKLFVGIKYGYDGTNVAMSIAVKTTDERIFIETIDCRAVRGGFKWMIDFIKTADVQKVIVDGASGQQLFAKEMKAHKLKIPILPTVKEIIVANAGFEQAVYAESVCHKGQTSLAEVVSNCEKRNIGSSGGFGYKAIKEGAEIALMDSIILAHWACAETKEKKKQRITY
ncbi:MAG: terminase, partial [Cellulosilyticaceae bacterium]